VGLLPQGHHQALSRPRDCVVVAWTWTVLVAAALTLAWFRPSFGGYLPALGQKMKRYTSSILYIHSQFHTACEGHYDGYSINKGLVGGDRQVKATWKRRRVVHVVDGWLLDGRLFYYTMRFSRILD
jgi:hypothetical protein